MFELDSTQLPGKLVRVKLNRGIIKDMVGVFIAEGPDSIRVWELMTMNQFRLKTIPKTHVVRILTVDLATGEWPEG